MGQLPSWAFWGCRQELAAQSVDEGAWCSLAGLPSSVLRGGWIDWADAVELFDAAEHLVGDDGVRSAGRRLVGHAGVEAVRQVLPVARHPELPLHALGMLLGAIVMPTSHWTVHSNAEGACVTGSVPRSLPGCPAAFTHVSGVVEMAPTVMGHPPVDVSMRCTDHSATIMVRYTLAEKQDPPTAAEVTAIATRLLRMTTTQLTSTQHDLAAVVKQRDAYRAAARVGSTTTLS